MANESMGPTAASEYVDPCYIAWEIISACNLGCRFCYSSSWNYQRDGSNSKDDQMPSVEFVKEKLELLKKAFPSLEYINWTGGEPLLRRKKDLGEIFKISKQLGLKNILSTNAYFSEAGLTKKEFLDLLDSWSENLDVLSVSLDSSDSEVNNNKMRVLSNGGFDSTTKSEHLQDVEAILDAYAKRQFPFALKINTMVTAKNHASLTKMVERLANISCIWHLIEFNPRQCPEESIKEFELKGGEDSFEKIVMRINQECERQKNICKFTITTRAYDGKNNPYWFLVLNTRGEVLLPIGKEHCVITIIKNDTSNFMELREIVTASIHETVSNKNSSYQLRADAVAAFNEGNKKILARYLHHTASAVRAAFVLPWLREMLSEALTFPTHKVDMLGMFVEGKYNEAGEYCSPPIEALAKTYLKQLERSDENEDLSHIGALLLEQPRVGRFLSVSYGVLGGTLVLLPKKAGKRLSPALEQNPPGLHMPWCFPTSAEKRKFFRGCFPGGVIQQDADDYHASAEFSIKPSLTAKLLDEVVKSSIVDAEQPGITSKVTNYLSTTPTAVDSDVELVLWIILSRCIEATLGKISSFSLNTEEDPWLSHFNGPERSSSYPTNPEAAKQSVIAFLHKLKQDSHPVDEQVERYWTPSDETLSEATSSRDVETVVASIWLFLYGALRTLKYPVPFTLAFRVGAGTEHVAIGALYVVKEPSLEPLTDPVRAKRRLGALLETLATPAFSNQLQSLKEQKVEDELMRKEVNETKKTQEKIKEDINKLLQVSWEISLAASNIANEIKIVSFEHLAKQLGKFFDINPTDYFIDLSNGYPRPQQGNDVVGANELRLRTVHASGNVTKAIWITFTKMLNIYSKALHQPWLERIASVPFELDNQSVGQTAFDLIKTITYRADTSKNRLHAIQLIFALRNASAKAKIPVVLEVNGVPYEFEVKDEYPDYRGWLVKTFSVFINGYKMYSGEAEMGYPLPDTKTSISTTDALINLVDSLLPKGTTNDNYVTLKSAKVVINTINMVVKLDCGGQYVDKKNPNQGSLTKAINDLAVASNCSEVLMKDWFNNCLETNTCSIEITFNLHPVSIINKS